MNLEEKEIAFNNILNEYQDKIYRICLGYLYNRSYADDCYQEALVNIWKSIDRFKAEASLGTYIYRITVNTTITFNKKEKKNESLYKDVGENSVEQFRSSDSKIDETEPKMQRLYKAINQLGQQEKMIITMALEGIGNKEIAEILGISANGVGVKIYRAKEFLSKEIKK